MVTVIEDPPLTGMVQELQVPRNGKAGSPTSRILTASVSGQSGKEVTHNVS